MKIGLVGKPNTGKSTFFNAATDSEIEIANYPFTTIDPNKGIGYGRKRCVCKDLNLKCSPKNSKCIERERFIPIEIIDVAGLVPGAYEGKGMGNEFLNDLMIVDCLIHVVDISGTTDEKGQVVSDASYDPKKDISFLENEIDQWLLSIVKKRWDRISKRAQYSNEKLDDLLFKQLSGLAISLNDITSVLKDFKIEIKKIDDQKLFEIVRAIRKKTKPTIIAANKFDLKKGKENFERLKKEFLDLTIIPVCAEAELILKKAQKEGLIKYLPGDSNFKIKKEMSLQQKKALDIIQNKVLDELKSTGVQKVINTAIFDILKLKAAYPVEDENKYTDKDGNILPDVYLLKNEATTADLAYKIHSDIGENLITAYDVNKKRKISKNANLEDDDIIKFFHK